MVGLRCSPCSAVLGGLGLGIPRFPVILSTIALASPQTKAPAPSITLISKLWPEPKIFSPRNPIERAVSMAFLILFTARGYSVLTYTMPSSDPIAFAAIIIPSTTEWGLPTRMDPSMKAPGSPSSPLQRIYFFFESCFNASVHFLPAGNPPPPRPLSPASMTTWQISSGVI